MLPVLFLYSCGTRFARNCRTFRCAACRSAKPRVAATSSPFPRLLFGGLQVSSLFPMRQALSRSLSFGGLRAGPADYCTDSQGVAPTPLRSVPPSQRYRFRCFPLPATPAAASPLLLTNGLRPPYRLQRTLKTLIKHNLFAIPHLTK